jgi:DNA gyrase/topoisomerase IV subunit A
MMMEITKKELLELRIKDVFVTEGETLCCRMIYDLIEGHINKRHIMEWCTIQLREMLFMKALLLVAGKENIDATIKIIKCCTPGEVIEKLQAKYGIRTYYLERILDMGLSDLSRVQIEKEKIQKSIKRRKLLVVMLRWLMETSNIY